MATAPKFPIDVNIHNLLTDSSRQAAEPAAARGLTPPESGFPRYPEKLTHPEPETLDIRFSEHAHDHSITTGLAINETPMLEHDERWKALAPRPGRFAFRPFLGIANRGEQLEEPPPRCEGRA